MSDPIDVLAHDFPESRFTLHERALKQAVLAIASRLAALERQVDLINNAAAQSASLCDRCLKCAMSSSVFVAGANDIKSHEQVDGETQYCTCDSKSGTVTHEDSVGIIHEYCRDCNKEIGREACDTCKHGTPDFNCLLPPLTPCHWVARHDTTPPPKDDHARCPHELYLATLYLTPLAKYLRSDIGNTEMLLVREILTDLVNEARKTA